MSLLSKTDILSADDLKTQDVAVPEWYGIVRIRSLTGRERDAFEAGLVKGEGKERKVDMANMRARLVGLTVINEFGERLFTDDEVELLGAKSGAALDRVFSAAQRLNSLASEDVEQLTKNSSGAQSAVSISDYASPSATDTQTSSLSS
jgi:endo-alpha-1,4-polygalactosaminidase (GH114 family)